MNLDYENPKRTADAQQRVLQNLSAQNAGLQVEVQKLAAIVGELQDENGKLEARIAEFEARAHDGPGDAPKPNGAEAQALRDALTALAE